MSDAGLESFVTVAPDSTGKDIRNLQVVVYDQTSNTFRTKQEQVVALVDPENGNVLPIGEILTANRVLQLHTVTLLRILAKLLIVSQCDDEQVLSETEQDLVYNFKEET